MASPTDPHAGGVADGTVLKDVFKEGFILYY